MKRYRWCVVGAGPAGISAVGKLLDSGVSGQEIAWIDPVFHVGDLGRKWHRVFGNTAVHFFLKFLHARKSFQYKEAPPFHINTLSPEKSCPLSEMVTPLSWVTNQLRTVVDTLAGHVRTLSLEKKCWQVRITNADTIETQRVILATGSHPKRLSYAMDVMPLEMALNDEKLQKEPLENETIAVFGSSHSAIVALKIFTSTACKKNN